MNDYDYMPDFTSIFKDEFVSYINFKRGVGYLYRKQTCYIIKEIDTFFDSISLNQKKITQETFDKWQEKVFSTKNCLQTKCKKIIAFHTFCKYLNILGYENVIIPELVGIKNNYEFLPYIFNDEEIQEMMRILVDEKEIDKKHETFYMLFCLYYCCGLRFSEAKNLQLKHFIENENVLIIEKSKNLVTRQIPLSKSLAKNLKKYIKNTNYSSDEDYIFVNNKNEHISNFCVRKLFHNLIEKANIPPRHNGSLVRIHDLRHTFAVNTLKQMPEKGFDLYTSISILSVYLGHKSIVETEYYLRLVDTELANCQSKIYDYTKGIYKEIDDE